MSATLTRSLIRYANFGRTGPLRRLDCFDPLLECQCNEFLPRTQRSLVRFRNRTDNLEKERVNNFAVANLRSHPLSCTAASLGISVMCLSQTHHNAIRTLADSSSTKH